MLSHEIREVAIRAARRRFADLVNRVSYRGERTVLTRNGKRLAAVVPLRDLRKLLELETGEGSAEGASSESLGKRIARRMAAELDPMDPDDALPTSEAEDP